MILSIEFTVVESFDRIVSCTVYKSNKPLLISLLFYIIFVKKFYRLAEIRIPVVVTGGPWQDVRERSQKKSQRPRDNHVVIEVHVKRNQNHRVTDACEAVKQYRV